MKWNLMAMAGLLVGLTGCFPTVDQMHEMARQHPTLQDVKLLQMEDHQYVKELVDTHDANISAQHKIQTPDVAPAIQAERDAAAKAMQKVLDQSIAMLRQFEVDRGGANPFGNNWTEALFTALAGGGLGAGLMRLGSSRAAGKLQALELALATAAGPGKSVPTDD